MGLRDVVEWSGALTVILGALALVGRWVLRPLVATLAGVREFLVDWQGRPERPGHAREPGVPERLRTIEGRVAVNTSKLTTHIEESRALVERIDDDLERVRLAGHREAEAMWNALGALADSPSGRREHDPNPTPNPTPTPTDPEGLDP